MRFRPASVTVQAGETVRFLLKNSGALKHEFVLGSKKDLREHAAAMKRLPDMEHTASNMATLGPGEGKEMVWKFSAPGTVFFACLQPGHYDAGMTGDVTVKARAGKARAASATAH
jgi:uncharacterized cupredoxin-like copper-binding protein